MGSPDNILDRDPQLASLRRELIDGAASTVCLHGARGSGRTSLAMIFAENSKEDFPGGMKFVSATERSNELDLSYIDQLSKQGPALIVLDDADMFPIDSLRAELDALRSLPTDTRVLMTSVIPLHVGDEAMTVPMPPLSTETIVTLLRCQAPLPAKELERFATRIEGNPLLARLVGDRLGAGMPWRPLLRLLEELPIAGTVDPAGKPLTIAEAKQFRTLASTVNDALIAALAENPELMYQLDPRRFEELVVELYRRQGFEATLTPASGDGGADVYVVENNALGRSLTVIQAKRYAADNKVGVGVVRELLGTIDITGASTGMVLTTSFFTSGARELERNLEYRVALRDYFALQDLLQLGTKP